MKKTLLTLTIALTAGFAHAQCTAGFTWSQSQPNVIDFTDVSVVQNPGLTLYSWDFGDNQFASSWGGNTQHHYSTPGTYPVCLTLIDSVNLSTSTFCDTITVTGTFSCIMQSYAYAFNASCPTCANGTGYTYAWDGSPPFTYQWSNGDTTQGTSGLLPGMYTACITDFYGCVVCDTIQVNSMPVNCNVTYWTTFGNGGQVAFNANATNVSANHTITWDFGDMTTGTGTYAWHQYAQSGTYTVCAMLYDSVNLCRDTFCSNVNVTITTPPCVAAFYVQMDTVNPNQAWIYNVSTGSPTMTYEWYWGDNTSDTGAYPSHIYQQTGTVMICLVVVDLATSCSDTMCQYLNVVRLSQQAAQVPFYVNVVPPIGMGVTEANAQSNWTLFPNPSDDVLNISNVKSSDEYIITDLAGRVVLSGTMLSNTVSIAALNSGTYIFTLVKENGETESKRFIRE